MDAENKGYEPSSSVYNQPGTDNIASTINKSGTYEIPSAANGLWPYPQMQYPLIPFEFNSSFPHPSSLYFHHPVPNFYNPTHNPNLNYPGYIHSDPNIQQKNDVSTNGSLPTNDQNDIADASDLVESKRSE